jgi:hypothetical protein
VKCSKEHEKYKRIIWLKGGVDNFSAKGSVVRSLLLLVKEISAQEEKEGYQDISDSRKQFLSLSAREW